MMAICIICREREATVLDRNEAPFGRRKKLCATCHAERLKNDMVDILIVERRRRKAEVDRLLSGDK